MWISWWIRPTERASVASSPNSTWPWPTCSFELARRTVLERRFNESRCYRMMNSEWRQDASQGARAQRVAAQRRAHGAQVGTVALGRPRRGPFLVIKFGLNPARGVRRARSWFDYLAKSSGARAFMKGSHLGLSAPKAPELFSNAILSRSRRPVRISCLRLLSS
jgi:hypothetical protein